MDTNRSNNSIGCTVSDCKYNNKQHSTCSLSAIQVGRCGPASSSCGCTECDSYELDKSSNV